MAVRETPPDAPKRGIRFDATINLGHILTFLGFIVTGMIAWSTMDRRVAVLEEGRAHQERRDAAQDIVSREKFDAVQKALDRIQHGVDRINERWIK